MYIYCYKAVVEAMPLGIAHLLFITSYIHTHMWTFGVGNTVKQKNGLSSFSVG